MLAAAADLAAAALAPAAADLRRLVALWSAPDSCAALAVDCHVSPFGGPLADAAGANSSAGAAFTPPLGGPLGGLFAGLPALAGAYLSSPLLMWGAGPALVAAVTYVVLGLGLELLLVGVPSPVGRRGAASGAKSAAAPVAGGRRWWPALPAAAVLEYRRRPRAVAIAATRRRYGAGTQLRRGLLLAGPAAAGGFALQAVILAHVAPGPFPGPAALLAGPGWAAAGVAAQPALCLVVADFVLYWLHRFAHEVPWLWRFHKHHHRTITPTPMGTLYSSVFEAVFVAGPPMTAAALLVRPHPLAFLAFVYAHLANGIADHCGAEAWWLDALAGFKQLPGRAPVEHHDVHHRFGNRGRGAGNYGEAFIVWDWLFGTLDGHRADGRGSGGGGGSCGAAAVSEGSWSGSMESSLE